MPTYTRRGDEGETSLAHGERITKASPRLAAMGDLDELTCTIALAREAQVEPSVVSVLTFIEHRLLNCAGMLADPERSEQAPAISVEDIGFIEVATDHFTASAGPLRHFILQGGCEASARLGYARAVARRAERSVVALSNAEEVPAEVLALLNRISDLLFAAARHANARAGVAEVHWDPSAPPPDLT